MKEQSPVVMLASAFAHAAHGAVGQKRKYDGIDYIAHPYRVAQIVANAGGTDDMVAAAWLHDVVEDTAIERGMIAYFFGEHVAQLVVECSHIDRTNDARKLNRFERTAIELARAADISPEAKTIKLADLLDNTSSICQHDPEFAKVYMPEKRRLLMVLVGGHEGLHAAATAQVNAYFAPPFATAEPQPATPTGSSEPESPPVPRKRIFNFARPGFGKI